MCSAFILVNVLIFALPMSTTQVVISGLTGVSVIFFSAVEANLGWFIQEIALWVSCPIAGMLVSYSMHKLMKKHIFDSKNARKRVLIMTPYQMTISFYLMFGFALTKSYLYSNKLEQSRAYTIIYSIFMLAFPFLMLPISRFFLLRKARNLEWVRVKRYQKQKDKTRKMLMKSITSLQDS